MDERKRGIIYIGNLPYGFYEESLKGFFGQFGEITRLKVKRSDKNSNPMGYAYIEFDLEKVAKIAAKTMDGHLMNKKILKCKVVKGSSNKIFRKYNITPEFCTGTKRKRRNQHKLEKANEEKILKRVEKSRSRIFKALGSKVGARFLKTSKIVNPESDDTKATEGIKSSVDEPLQTGTSPAEKKKTKSSKNRQFKTPEKSVGSINTLVKDTPKIYMDIEGEDDEIQLKTPPNVIKRFKNAAKIGSSLKKRLNKKNDASSPSNINKTDSKVQKKRRSVMRIQKEGRKLKQGLNGETNVNGKDKIKINKEKLSSTNVNKSRANKLMQLKRKADSVTDKQTGKSKKSKFSIKKIQNIKEQNKKRRVELLSFKKGDLTT